MIYILNRNYHTITIFSFYWTAYFWLRVNHSYHTAGLYAHTVYHDFNTPWLDFHSTEYFYIDISYAHDIKDAFKRFFLRNEDTIFSTPFEYHRMTNTTTFKRNTKYVCILNIPLFILYILGDSHDCLCLKGQTQYHRHLNLKNKNVNTGTCRQIENETPPSCERINILWIDIIIFLWLGFYHNTICHNVSKISNL